MTLFLLAAGLGTRLRPITNELAKPAVPLLNIPLLHWCAAFLKDSLGRESVQNIVVNTHHRPESLRQPIADLERIFSAVPVRVSHEDPEPLGAGGALVFARDLIAAGGSDLCLIANADEFLIDRDGQVIERMAAAHRQSGAIATLMVMDHPEAGASMGAAWTDSDGTVLGFGRDRSKWPDGARPKHYVGVALINWREVLRYLPASGKSCLLYDGLTRAIADGQRVSTFDANLFWAETGSPQHFADATLKAFQLLSLGRADAPEQKFLNRMLAELHPPGDFHFWQDISTDRAALIAADGNSPQDVHRFIMDFSSKTNPLEIAVIGPHRLPTALAAQSKGTLFFFVPSCVVDSPKSLIL